MIEPAQYWSATEIEPGQEIVFIGARLDHAQVHDLLRAALLTDAELAAGQAAWIRYPDPLPEWGITHSHP